MITFVPAFVSSGCAAWEAEVKARMVERGQSPSDWEAAIQAGEEYAKTVPRPVATVAQVADHVEHARAVAGAAHVGLGGDYDGVDVLPVGLEDVSGYPLLFAELIERGWSDPELAGLACRNVLRVLREAEGVASRLQTERLPSTMPFTG